VTDSAARPDPDRPSLEELEQWIKDAEGEWVDLRGRDLTGIAFKDVLKGLPLKHAIFGCHDAKNERPAARLHKTSFRNCTLVECKFAGVDCDGTDFRHARLTKCDLRYASFVSVTFADAKLVLCDLYRAVFEKGVVFENAELEGVSLHQASLGGIVGLRRRESFKPRNGPALAQDDEKRYVELLKQTTQKHAKGCEPPSKPDETTEPEDRRLPEAILTYRALSGLWSGQGLFADAAGAYVETKRHERTLAWHRDRSSPGALLRWLGLWFAEALCLFGEGLGRVLGWIAVLALVPGFIYWRSGGVTLSSTETAGLGDCLLFSAARLTATTPDRLSPATPLVEWIGVAQTFVGIALLGLFGFVLGNKLRSS
jgi:Pentapeptide repeats (9 copies)